jgi:hypothetical protein
MITHQVRIRNVELSPVFSRTQPHQQPVDDGGNQQQGKNGGK